jgi:DNA-binding Lrp family transcriptional regulator
MMHRAFILMETAIGKTAEVLGSLRRLDGIKTLDTVTGPYDIIVEIEKDDLNALRKLIATRIHPMEGVRRVVSCMAPCVTVSEAVSPFEVETSTPEKVLSTI